MEVNQAVVDDPSLVNSDPTARAGCSACASTGDAEDLLTAEEYAALTAGDS